MKQATKLWQAFWEIQKDDDVDEGSRGETENI